MPKFLVEIVYSYEIEAESKDIAELHGQDVRDYIFDDCHKFNDMEVRVVRKDERE